MADKLSHLAEQAQMFASELTETVRAVSPDCDPFRAKMTESGERFTIGQSPNEGIPLAVNDEPLLLLKVGFYCLLGSHGTYMAVEQSWFKVLAISKGDREPIVRFDFERNPRNVPSAQIHVHGHRDALSHLLAKTGMSTRRGKNRAQSDSIPKMQDLHLPVGGHRYRPCLEDVLEMLIDEFGVDHQPSALEALRVGRMAWRTKQLNAAVSDNPSEAAKALRGCGYEVVWPHSEPEPMVDTDRLASL